MLRVAVVGSGPSGCYTAQSTKASSSAAGARGRPGPSPCPYGLVRYGVAPDHGKIKSLQNTLRTVLEHERVRFLGGVPVGPGGVPTARLRGLAPRGGVLRGRRHRPAPRHPRRGAAGARLVGDRVRVLVQRPSGRRGRRLPARCAVGGRDRGGQRRRRRGADAGTRHLAERFGWHQACRRRRSTPSPPGEVDGGAHGGPAGAIAGPLHRRGCVSWAPFRTRPSWWTRRSFALDPAYRDPSGLPVRSAATMEVLRGWAGRPANAARRIRPRFFLRPVELTADGGDHVRAVRFERTAPDGRGGVTGTGRYEEIAAQLVLRSVGYRGVPLEGLPFDAASGTVPHRAGACPAGGRGRPGEYVAGWIKRGPTGVIGSQPPVREGDGDVPAGGRRRARGAGPSADPLTLPARRGSSRSSGPGGGPSSGPGRNSAPRWGGTWSSCPTGSRC